MEKVIFYLNTPKSDGDPAFISVSSLEDVEKRGDYIILYSAVLNYINVAGVAIIPEKSVLCVVCEDDDKVINSIVEPSNFL